MAKDPAFLFYPGDWLGGTMLLTRHQKGCYIDLLMAQFNYGPLSLEQIKIILGTDQASWTVLQEKFKRDANGKFFNEKLATEINKRKNYVVSRSANKKGKIKSYDKSCENHMNHHMENENRNENEIKDKGVQGKKDLTVQEISNTIEYVERIKQVKLSADQVLNYWEAFKLNQAEPYYSSESKKIKHFRDWLKNQKNGHANNSTGNKSNRDRQSAANADLINELRGIITG